MSVNLRNCIAWAAILVLYTLGMTAVDAQPLPNPFTEQGAPVVTTLASGLRLIVCENHALPMIAMQVVVRGGSSSEVNAPGVAHYLEHVSFQGTTHFPDPLAPQYALEEAGGLSNGETTRDSTTFQAEIASDNAELLVNVLADIVLHPLLTDAGCEREHPVISAEIAREHDDPLISTLNAAYAFSYPSHPYRDVPEGNETDIVGITPAILRAFHDRWYVPRNLSVIMVGDITAKMAETLVTKAFSLPDAPSPPAFPDAALANTGGQAEVHLSRDIAVTYQVLAFSVPALRDFPATVATDLVQTLLVDGPQALLPARWARDGVACQAYGIECVGSRDAGRMLIWAQTSPEMAGKLRDSTLAALDDLARGPLPASLVDAARQRLATQFVQGNATFDQQAETLAFYEGRGQAEMAELYLPTIWELPAEQVRAVVPTIPLSWVTMGQSPKG